jgi:hypothetical protein
MPYILHWCRRVLCDALKSPGVGSLSFATVVKVCMPPFTLKLTSVRQAYKQRGRYLELFRANTPLA